LGLKPPDDLIWANILAEISFDGAWTTTGWLMLFADDTNLFGFGESFSIVNQKANELCIWFIANTLSLNLTKTCYMVYTANCDDNVELYCGHRNGYWSWT